MSDFVPKKTDAPCNAGSDREPPQQEFTPKGQRLPSQNDTSKNVDKTEFKSKQIEQLPNNKPTKPEPLKNIQVPSRSGNLDDSTEETAATHKANVKIVRNGDSITQIIVECSCGETIPLDCIY